MVALPQPSKFTEREYLALEAAAETKHEFVHGYIIAMAGADLVHNLIAGNALYELRRAIGDGPCEVVGSDQRVKLDASRDYFYPDVTLLSEPPVLADAPPRALTNPTAVVEVLSPSMAAYDVGTKLELYQQLVSLTDIVFIASDRRQVMHYQRLDAARWTNVASHDTVRFHNGLAVEVDDLYRRTEL